MKENYKTFWIIILLFLSIACTNSSKDTSNNNVNSIAGTYQSLNDDSVMYISLKGNRAKIECKFQKGSMVIPGDYFAGGDYPHGKEFPKIDVSEEFGADPVFRDGYVTFFNRQYKKVE